MASHAANASNGGTASASASAMAFKSSGAASASSSSLKTGRRHICVPRASRPRFALSVGSGLSGARLDRSFTAKAKECHCPQKLSIRKSAVNKIVAHGSANNSAVPAPSVEVSSKGDNEEAPTAESSSPSNPSLPDAQISAFMSEVTNLIKLVESRDIMELKVKQNAFEILIRKKLQPTFSVPPPPPPPVPVAPASSLANAAIVPVSPPPPPSPSPAPSVSKQAQADRPCLKSPMAGTFYRSPGPGESSFVKVGDKVQKGQVVCIVEAMKLMNEIETDQSGTIVEILAEDGKPVSVDTPLFVIKP
uniref:Biotin carboxyl carrier protein of acetyl-CoA carboxylase n=1 Tax=Gnetum ula TaxID=3383 RepID=A0A499UEZ9_9SPER|nr:acetyl-CoA carboxylase, biotin carboxyl carrier protein [Gnetum ula]